MTEAIERAAETLAARFAAQVDARMPEVRERFQAIERMLGMPFSDSDVCGHAFAEVLGLVTLITEPAQPVNAEALEGFRLSSRRIGLHAIPAVAPDSGLVLLPELHRVIIVGSDGGHVGEDLGYLSSIFALRFAGEHVASRAREDATFEVELARAVWRRVRPVSH